MNPAKQLQALADSLTAIGLKAKPWSKGRTHRVYFDNKANKIDQNIKLFFALSEADAELSRFATDGDVLSQARLAVQCYSPGFGHREKMFFDTIRDRIREAVKAGELCSPSLLRAEEAQDDE